MWKNNVTRHISLAVTISTEVWSAVFTNGKGHKSDGPKYHNNSNDGDLTNQKLKICDYICLIVHYYLL
jgi:hypothetical protein